MRDEVRAMICEKTRDVIQHIRENFWRSVALFLMAMMFWVWAFPHAYRLVVPPSRYLAVEKISVNSSPVGISPAVDLKREIRQSFNGSFTAVLRKHDPIEATIWQECDGARDADVLIPFTKGAPYPGRPLTWWLGSPPEPPCMPGPGKYSLRIEWTIMAFWGLIPLKQTKESDTFLIYDPALVRTVEPALAPLILDSIGDVE